MIVDRKLKILLVVDMQYDFIKGKLGTEQARAIIDRVNKKIADYREAGYIIIFTRDTHYDNYLDTSEGKKLPVPHCKIGTEGWQIIPEIEVFRDDIIINKETFGSLELAELIKNKFDNASIEIEAIEIIGVCTDICVISNAIILKAKLPEIVIIVDSSCCAGVTPESHDNALKAMQMCQIEII